MSEVVSISSDRAAGTARIAYVVRRTKPILYGQVRIWDMAGTCYELLCGPDNTDGAYIAMDPSGKRVRVEVVA